MAFKFNFVNSGVDNIEETFSKVIITGSMLTGKCAVEVHPVENKVLENLKTIHHTFNNITLGILDPQALEKYVTENALDDSETAQAVLQHVDLHPGVYEGGFKVWECGFDLAEFICEQCIDFSGKRVLELGCGAGIPGLCAMRREAEAVHFQDFNREVIEKFTVVNVLLNRKNKCECRFFAGDWSDLANILKNNSCRYDYILTAETIYNTENYAKLVNVFDTVLTPNGLIYLSAKSNYFGVGGGTHLFGNFLVSTNKFTSEVCLKIEANVPREILKIERKQFPT